MRMSITSPTRSARFMATEQCGYATGFRDTLGALADPKAFTGAIDLAQVESGWAVSKLRDMIRIRVAEEFVGELSESGEARCPCHLGIGQEAVAVGVSAHLKPSDRVFGAHRSHSHFLALGGGLTELFGEVLGKEIGSSKGMGGSMHLSLIHISEPTRRTPISYAVFCLK